MRSLFENLLDAPLQYPLAWQDPGIQGSRAVRPRYWLSYDIDCLRKWKACTWLRHFLAMPRFVLQGRLWRWLMLVAEAWRSRRPEQDPWYMIPFMLQALRNEHATFFFLGHPSDHKSYRYDIRRKEYARLAQRVLVHHHQVGLHGSPLHATRKDALAVEKSVLEQVVEQPIAVHRQHYLRVQPGVTIPYLDQLGFHYDSSLGFNTRTGFRCGSCTPIPWWDFASNKALQIQEIPLIAGDWTLHNPEHFDESQTRHRLRELALQVQLAGGILALDFHEIYFSKDYPGHAELHQRLLEGLKDYGWAGWLPQ